MIRAFSITRELQKATAEGTESRVMALLSLAAIGLSLFAGLLTVLLILFVKLSEIKEPGNFIRFVIALCPILGRVAILAAIIPGRRRPGSLSLNAILISAVIVILFWYLPGGGIAHKLETLRTIP